MPVRSSANPPESYPQIPLHARSLADIEMIAIGGFSPLDGFLNRDDYESVVSKCRLANGVVWPIPITLAVSDDVKENLMVGAPVALTYNGAIVAILDVEDIFTYDKKAEARQVYKTEDLAHPGVAKVYEQPDTYVGGKLEVLRVQDHGVFAAYNLTPSQTRREFEARNWKTIVGFQTRNPIHRAHEYIMKAALEMVDGLLVHPLVGATKEGDIPAEARMQSYEVLLKNYYPPGRTMLAINPSNMYYAGPREAVLHALVRKNYGCTHFIVGRDHAGVGNYYGTYEAQDFIRSFDKSELGITPLCFEELPGFSGTNVREMLAAGKMPPPEIMRPEVAEILIKAMKK